MMVMSVTSCEVAVSDRKMSALATALMIWNYSELDNHSILKWTQDSKYKARRGCVLFVFVKPCLLNRSQQRGCEL